MSRMAERKIHLALFRRRVHDLLAQLMDDDPQHLFLGGRLARPNLELPRTLVDEHLDARDHRNSFFPRRPDQRRIDRVIDQVEDQPGIDLIRLQQRLCLRVRAFLPESR